MSVVQQIINENLGKKLTVTGGDSGQCTAVPHREQQILGLSIVYGNAKDTFDNAPASLYDKNVNTPTFVPREGAIGVNKTAPYGHTYIIEAQGTDTKTMHVVEQNNPLGHPVEVNTRNYTGVYGFFTPKVLATQVAQPTLTTVDIPKADNEGVVNGQGLHVHTQPNLSSSWPWYYDDNEHITLLSKTTGENVTTGPYAPSSVWYQTDKGWVSDAYVRTTKTPANVPEYQSPATPPPPLVYSPRPALGLFGVDVSSVGQGKIDWDKLVNGDGTVATQGAGIDFAVARAGHVGDTHGGDSNFKDPQFDFNRSEALRLGVPFGAYWFCYPSLDPKAEAQAFANVVAQVEDSESLWADIETAPVAGDYDLIEWSKTFKTEVERLTGHKCRAYYNLNFHNTFPSLADVWGADGVWAAKYDNDPAGRPFPEAIMHQYTSSGVLPGITGKVDLNVAWMTRDDFLALGRKLGGGTIQPPVPTGTPGVDPTLSDKLDAQTNLIQQILVLLKQLFTWLHITT